MSPSITPGRLEHRYGPHVHILDDPWTRTLAAWLSHPEVRAPRFHRLLEALYRSLLTAACEQLPTRDVTLPTRMTEQHPGVGFAGAILDPDAKIVVVDLARAGIVPSYLMQQSLLEVLDPDAVRVDHVYMQRVADEQGRVTHVDISGSKIGGPVHGSTLIIPDPMGATGTSACDALDLYAQLDGGPPAQMVLCHLMVTPEYLRRVTTAFPEAHVYAVRLDRGLSAPDVLATTPGTRWDEERGLDQHDYIVPGAGGLGELINNAFV